MAEERDPELMKELGCLVHLRMYDLALQKLQNLLYTTGAGLESQRRRAVGNMLREFSTECLRNQSQASVQEKLQLLEFLLSCFSEAYDTEGQLIIYYEGLVLRETYGVTYPELRVTPDEWIEFGRECSRNGYYANSVKAFDMGLSHIISDEARRQVVAEKESALRRTKRTAVESQAVNPTKVTLEPVTPKPDHSSGTARYLSAIKRLNRHKLEAYRQQLGTAASSNLPVSEFISHLDVACFNTLQTGS